MRLLKHQERLSLGACSKNVGTRSSSPGRAPRSRPWANPWREETGATATTVVATTIVVETAATATAAATIVATARAIVSDTASIVGGSDELRSRRRGWSGRCGDESSVRRAPVRHRLRMLLKKEHVASLHETGEDRKSREQGTQSVVFCVHAGDKLMDEGAVVDGSVAIGEVVGQLLKTMTIVVRRKISLGERVKCSLKMNGTTGLVAGEDVAQMTPDGVCASTGRTNHHVDEVFRDSGEDP